MQEKTDNLNSPIPMKDIEFVVENLPIKKTPGQNGSTNDSIYK